jgi:hypothetical protein
LFNGLELQQKSQGLFLMSRLYIQGKCVYRPIIWEALAFTNFSLQPCLSIEDTFSDNVIKAGEIILLRKNDAKKIGEFVKILFSTVNSK